MNVNEEFVKLLEEETKGRRVPESNMLYRLLTRESCLSMRNIFPPVEVPKKRKGWEWL